MHKIVQCYALFTAMFAFDLIFWITALIVWIKSLFQVTDYTEAFYIIELQVFYTYY